MLSSCESQLDDEQSLLSWTLLPLLQTAASVNLGSKRTSVFLARLVITSEIQKAGSLMLQVIAKYLSLSRQSMIEGKSVP